MKIMMLTSDEERRRSWAREIIESDNNSCTVSHDGMLDDYDDIHDENGAYDINSTYEENEGLTESKLLGC